MTAIPREQAEVHIRDVLTEFINMAQGVKDSGITVNANGKRILDGLETAKKALVKLEENYFAQLSDGGIQTFLDKCKILARQFELEQSKKIQFLNVQKRTDLRRKKNYLVISCFSGESLNISQKILRKKTIAEAFAIYFRGTTVTGFTGGGIAVPSPSAEIDTAFIHQKGDPVWYKSWDGIRSYKYD